MRAHWHHLANTIEPVHPSAHSSPQPKRQMDRFSHFCTAYSRKCLYFTMGAPIHQNCPFRWGIWTCYVTHAALGPCEPQLKRHLDQFSCVCTDYLRVSLYGLPALPSKLFFPMLVSGPHVIHGSLGPPRVQNANGNLIVSTVFAGLTSVTD